LIGRPASSAKVYGVDALSLWQTLWMTAVKRKLMHDPRLGRKCINGSRGFGQVGELGSSPLPQPSDRTHFKRLGQAGPTGQTSATVTAPKGGAVDFRWKPAVPENIFGRVAAVLSVGRLWETVTGYDRLRQFMPDMIASNVKSRRRSDDCAHGLSDSADVLSSDESSFARSSSIRANTHWNFERIAGEFESFRGSIETQTDPVTHDSQMAFCHPRSEAATR